MPKLKQKAKLARNCTKCKPRASKFKIFGEGSSYPPGGGGGTAPLSHLPQLGPPCQDGGSATTIATTIIVNLAPSWSNCVFLYHHLFLCFQLRPVDALAHFSRQDSIPTSSLNCFTIFTFITVIIIITLLLLLLLLNYYCCNCYYYQYHYHGI